jgi:hypothetical protein
VAPLHRADDWLLERFPRLRPLCRYVVMRMVTRQAQIGSLDHPRFAVLETNGPITFMTRS